MRIITDIEEIKGKVVANTQYVSYGRVMVVSFEDDTCACIDVSFCNGVHSLRLVSYLSDYDRRDAGIITQLQYDVLVEAKDKADQENIVNHEIKLLAELKQKYEAVAATVSDEPPVVTVEAFTPIDEAPNKEAATHFVMSADTDFTSTPLNAAVTVLNTNNFHAILDLKQLYNVEVQGLGTYEIRDSVNALALGTTRHTTSKIDLASKVTAVVDPDGLNDVMSGMTEGYDVAVNFSDHGDNGWGGMHWATVPSLYKGWTLYCGYSRAGTARHATSWARDQLMFMKIQPDSDNPEVVRLASNHNLYEGNYRDEAPAALNFKGTKLYWSSNFGGRIGHSEVFVIDIPVALLSALEKNSSLASFNTLTTQFTDDYGVGFPAKGESHTDANTGVSMKRLTDVSEFTVGGTTPNNAYIVYSRYTPESSDGAYVLSFGDNSVSSWVVDAATGDVVRELEPLGKSIGENHEIRWDTSGNFPNRVYYVKGMKFYMIEDVSDSDTPTLIRDFSADVPTATKLYNDVEGNSTNDSNQWAWMASHYDGAHFRVNAFLHYDMAADSLDTLTPSDMADSALDFLSDDPWFAKPNMVEMALDGSGIILHTGRKWDDAAYGGKSVASIGTFFDGVYLWPTDFDYKTTPPLKVQVSETHSGWAYANDGTLGVVSQDNRLDLFGFVKIGQQALHNRVTDIDLNGRTVLLNESQMALNITP